MELYEDHFSKYGLSRVNKFLKSLINTNIERFVFSNVRLSEKDQDEFMAFLAILSTQGFSRISLLDLNLKIFNKETLLKGLEGLDNGTIVEIDFSQNMLCSFGFEFILRLNNLGSGKVFTKLFSKESRYISSEISIIESRAVKKLVRTLTEPEKLKFSKAYFRSVLKWVDSGNFDPIDIDTFGLKDEDLMPVLDEVLSEQFEILSGNASPDYVLKFMSWVNLPLQPQNLFFLMKRIFEYEKNVKFISYLKIDPVFKIELFLRACQFDMYNFVELDNLKIFPNIDSFKEKTPVEEFLEIWRGIFVERVLANSIEDARESGVEYSAEDNEERLESIEYEEDFEVLEAKVKNIVLPQLRKLCEKYLKGIQFVFPALYFLEKYKESAESAFPFINMASWLSWVCMKFVLEPKIIKKIEENHEINDGYSKLFKEILNLASPQLRLKLSGFLFDKVIGSQSNLYLSLTKNCSVNTLIPALAFCKILYQFSDNVERKNCEVLVKEILSKSSFAIYEGRHFRSLVSTILAVSEDSSLNSVNKLSLLLKILVKPGERQVAEQQFEQLFDLYKFAKPDDERYKRLMLEVNRLERLIREGKKSGLSLDVIQGYERELERVNDEIQEINGRSRVSFDQAKVDRKWRGLEGLLGLEFVTHVRSYVPQKLLPNGELRTLRRRALEDFNKFFKELDFKHRMSYLIMLQGLANLNKLKEFQGLEHGSFMVQARLVLQELFSLTSQEADAYQKVFSQCHNEAGLLTYCSKILSLKEDSAKQLYQLFNEFVKCVSTENSAEFYLRRYTRTDNLHFKTVFEGRNDLLVKWKSGESRDLNTFFRDQKITYRQYTPDYALLFNNKIFKHKHIEPSYYGELRNYLDARDESERAKALQNSKSLMEYRNRLTTSSLEPVQNLL